MIKVHVTNLARVAAAPVEVAEAELHLSQPPPETLENLHERVLVVRELRLRVFIGPEMRRKFCDWSEGGTTAGPRSLHVGLGGGGALTATGAQDGGRFEVRFWLVRRCGAIEPEEFRLVGGSVRSRESSRAGRGRAGAIVLRPVRIADYFLRRSGTVRDGHS